MNKRVASCRVIRAMATLGVIGCSLLGSKQAWAEEVEVPLSGPLVLVPGQMSPGEQCQKDQDGNGLDDDIELELANKVVPVFQFSDEENALRPDEPHVVFSIQRNPA